MAENLEGKNPQQGTGQNAESKQTDEPAAEIFTPENIKKAMDNGGFIEAKVKRTNGEIDEGWSISGIDGNKVSVFKFGDKKELMTKTVTLDELREWKICDLFILY